MSRACACGQETDVMSRQALHPPRTGTRVVAYSHPCQRVKQEDVIVSGSLESSGHAEESSQLLTRRGDTRRVLTQ
jgi:hypothetical protein